METNDPNLALTLSVPRCWELVGEAVVGRLAVATPDGPDIFPVNHVVDHGSVLIRTATGTKLISAAGQPVAFEVDGYDLASASAWSVVLRGHAVEVSEVDEVIAAMNLPLYPWHAGPKGHFLRIAPDLISGRQFHVLGGVTALEPAGPPVKG